MLRKASREVILLQILIIFVAPIFALYYGFIDSHAKFFLLGFSALIIYSIINREKWDYHDLGLRVDNIKSAWPYYTIITLLMIITLFILEHFLSVNHVNTTQMVLQRLIFFIPISVLQEFAFSVFLLKRLQLLFGRSSLIIFINALVFTFIHIIYPLMPVVAIFLFISSVVSSIVYLYKPNFLLVSISHCVANITAVLLGFFV